MNRPRMKRAIPLTLTLLVVALGLLATVAFADGRQAGHAATDQQAMTHSSTASSNATVTRKQLAFRNDMRRLWEDHVTWTRLAIISLTTDSPDTEATVGRLLRNQAHIGDAIKPFYGEAAGDELTRLLQEHILIAADIIAAARAGDGAGVADGQARWRTNADEIAAFLNAANPRAWKLRHMQKMLYEHLRLTTDEVVARLQADWAADVAAYDEIHAQALVMADELSTGIIRQFPHRFR